MEICYNGNKKNMETFLIVGFHILRGFVPVVRLVAIS